jgi:GNAT superfamily N-acetyltransferase
VRAVTGQIPGAAGHRRWGSGLKADGRAASTAAGVFADGAGAVQQQRQQRPLTTASQRDHQHTELAGTKAKRSAAPLVRDEEAGAVARIRLGFMAEPTYTVKALDESTWAAFAALVERNNGIFGGCWCMGFHPEDSRNAAHNRAAKEQRVRESQAHAALVFDGNDCVGWCQFGAPGEVPRIKNRAAYEKGRTASPDWRIACCYVGKGHRRQGVASVALAGALDLIAVLGGGTVEGYPENAGSVPAGFLFNGALSTYEKLGFVRDRKIGKHRWVVTRVVEPRS